MSKKTVRKRGKNGAKLKNMPPVGKRFSKDYQPENNGRHKKIENIIKEAPRDIQDKIYAVLHTALQQPNRRVAMELLKDREDELGEYGFVLQIAINSLAGKNGMAALDSILNRLIGRPKQQSDISFVGSDGEISKIIVEVKDFSKKGDSKGEISKKGAKKQA